MLTVGRELLHNARRKVYPDGSYEVMACSEPIFREPGWEALDYAEEARRKPGKEKSEQPPEKNAKNVERSRRRASAKLRDYALCTPFRWFVTLTLAPDKIDRYDMTVVVRKLKTWLDNRVRRKGLTYIVVPELHRDGAIHFHGFFTDVDMGFKDSGTIDIGTGKPKRPRSDAERADWLSKGGHIVYNLDDWSLGFSTAIELYGDKAKAVSYVAKYVTKATDKIGGRWYYSGGNLQAPEVEYWDISYTELVDADPEAYTFRVPEAGLLFAKKSYPPPDKDSGIEPPGG